MSYAALDSQISTVLLGPSGTLSLRRLTLTAQERGFEHVVPIFVDLSNSMVTHEADLESCENLATILSPEPHLVGFSCFYWNVLYFLKLASAVKSLRPSTLIVFGGPEATGDHERLLQRYHFIDAIVMGEGEESFCDLLTHLQQNHGKEIHSWLPSVHGIAYRRSDGTTAQTPPSRVVVLDDLPSPVLGEDRPVTNGVLLWELARGCPFRCTYCFESRMHHKQRFLSLSLAEQELRAICTDSRVKLVRCMIPTFNLDEDYALALVDLIEKYNQRGIRFQVELKPDRSPECVAIDVTGDQETAQPSDGREDHSEFCVTMEQQGRCEPDLLSAWRRGQRVFRQRRPDHCLGAALCHVLFAEGVARYRALVPGEKSRALSQ